MQRIHDHMLFPPEDSIGFEPVSGLEITVDGHVWLGRGKLIYPQFEDKPYYKWLVEFPEAIPESMRFTHIMVRYMKLIPPLLLLAEAAGDSDD